MSRSRTNDIATIFYDISNYVRTPAANATSTVVGSSSSSSSLDMPPPSYLAVMQSVKASSGESKVAHNEKSACSTAAGSTSTSTTSLGGIVTQQPSQQTVVVVYQQQAEAPRSVRELAEMERCRNSAIIVAILSLFCGAWCCAIPAIICAIKKPSEATRSTYKTAIILAAIGLLVGLITIVIIIVANVMVALQMSRVIDQQPSASIPSSAGITATLQSIITATIKQQ